MNLQRIKNLLKDAAAPPYRLGQIKQAAFRQLVSSWKEAAVLPPELRDLLERDAPVCALRPISEVESGQGDAIKVGFEIKGGRPIETVLMRHDDGRRTVCVSSQSGCAMRCAFCATGTLGFARNLTSEEIVDQVLFFARFLKKKSETVSNVVFMGMGEPMNNYDAVMEAIHILNASDCFGLGGRRLSMSTCGIVPGILRLADEPLQINLAISLHAPSDEIRNKLMPVNAAYPLAKLMPAIETYASKTGRKVFFEYLLIDGVNDDAASAERLASMLRHPLYHVNLIKYHATGAFVSSPLASRKSFMKILESRGVAVTHRVSFGEDVFAACGQLANIGSVRDTIDASKNAVAKI